MTNQYSLIPATMDAAVNQTMDPVMSSREIAELTGKRHDHVIRDIEKMLDDVALDRPKFGGVYMDAKGEQRKCYNLPKNLVYTLITGYRADLRLKIVNRWIALETNNAQPHNKPKRTRKPAIDTAFRKCLSIASMIPNLDENQRILMASRGTYNLTGINPLELMGITSIAAPVNDQHYTPTQLGEFVGLSGMKMNAKLAANGLQTRVGDTWKMTEEGRKFARVFDTTRRNGKGSQEQLKWLKGILDVLA